MASRSDKGLVQAVKHLWTLQLARHGLAVEKYSLDKLAEMKTRMARPISSLLTLA